MNSGFECNIVDLYDKFCELTQKQMNSAVRKALNNGSKELKKVTQDNITHSLKKRNNKHWYNGHRIEYNDRLEDAVMISKIEPDESGELSQKVHIMGNRNSGSGTYRARFLEKGTKERVQTKTAYVNFKKSRDLGRIQPMWFFKNAQAQVEPKLQSIYLNEIEKAIDKINNTKI